MATKGTRWDTAISGCDRSSKKELIPPEKHLSCLHQQICSETEFKRAAKRQRDLWPSARCGGSWPAPPPSGGPSCRCTPSSVGRGRASGTSSCRRRRTPRTSACPADRPCRLPVRRCHGRLFNYTVFSLTDVNPSNKIRIPMILEWICLELLVWI